MAGASKTAGFVNPKPNKHVFVPMKPITASTGHVISKSEQTERIILKDANGKTVIETFSVSDAKARVRIEMEKDMKAKGLDPKDFAFQTALDTIAYSDMEEVAAKAAALAKESAAASKQVEAAA